MKVKFLLPLLLFFVQISFGQFGADTNRVLEDSETFLNSIMENDFSSANDMLSVKERKWLHEDGLKKLFDVHQKYLGSMKKFELKMMKKKGEDTIIWTCVYMVFFGESECSFSFNRKYKDTIDLGVEYFIMRINKGSSLENLFEEQLVLLKKDPKLFYESTNRYKNKNSYEVYVSDLDSFSELQDKNMVYTHMGLSDQYNGVVLRVSFDNDIGSFTFKFIEIEHSLKFNDFYVRYK